VREGAADWEIFAWAVRYVIAKVGVFETIETDVRDKPLYKNYMRCKTDKLEYKGHTFTPNDKAKARSKDD